MQITDFDYFNDKELGNSCLIVGGAPNVQNIKFDNFNGKVISMGDIPLRIKDKCNIDYWVNANSYFPQPDNHFKILNEFKDTTLIFSSSVLSSRYKLDFNKIKKNLKISWFHYDQRHFNRLKCSEQIDYRFDFREELPCCENVASITVQEYLQNKFNSICYYSTASTVAIHAVAFAMIMGFKKIYLVGVDIPIYEKSYHHPGDQNLIDFFKNLKMTLFREKLIRDKYFYFRYYINKISQKFFKSNKKSIFYPNIPEILNDFQYLNNLCINNDISLYNLNENSTLRKIHNFKYIKPSQINL